jgi:hypothetical protein
VETPATCGCGKQCKSVRGAIYICGVCYCMKHINKMCNFKLNDGT